MIPILTLLLTGSCTTEKDSSGQSVSSSKDRITVRNARLRPAARGMTGGGYLTLYNGTTRTDTLTGVSTDAAERVEIHESVRGENGVTGMRPAGRLPVEAGSSLELKPGGFHLMLIQLNRDLSAGDSISITLHFARNDTLSVWIPVSRD